MSNNKRIVYKNLENGISIIIPTEEYLSNHSIEELAQKDVPSGLQYYIVDVSEIPEDRTFRNAWTWE